MRAAVPLVFLLLGPAAASGQEAKLSFDTPQIQLPTDSAAFQRLFDYDGDGDLDAVGGRVRKTSSAVTGYENRVWANDGTGVFQLDHLEFRETVPPDVNREGMPLAVGDLDGDGRDDFVEAAGSELWRYFSSGAAWVPFRKSVANVGAPILDVQVADFDGDGLDDVALLTATQVRIVWSAEVAHVLREDAPLHSHLPLSGMTDLVVLEGDGDALPDLLAVKGNEMTVVTVQGHRLSPGPSYAFAHNGPMVAAGDVDADGDQDIAAFYHGTLELFRCTGTTSWAAEPESAGGPATYLVDIDGDGDDDGVCCGGGGGGEGNGTFPTLGFASDFEITLNSGGVLAPAFAIPGLGSRALAGAADVDGDGDVDLVAGRCVYFNRGSWEAPISPGLDWLWGEPELADLDGDGDRDATREPLYFPFDERVFANRGDASYEWRALDLDSAPGSLQGGQPRLNGDFDGDGDQDFILGLWDPALGHLVSFGFWRNVGADRFEYAGIAFLPGAPYSSYGTAVRSSDFLIGDLQADGDLDIVFVFRWTDYTTFVYTNDGTGSFTLRSTYRQEGATALLDLDQDGLLDLLLYGGVRYGVASPTPFGGLRQHFYLGSGDPNGLIVEDFNGDGYPDIVAPYPAGTILLDGLPLGAGPNFVTAWSAAPLPSGARTQALDADLDGLVDLVIGPWDAGPPDRVFRFYHHRPSAGPTLGSDAFESTEFVFRGPVPPYGVTAFQILRDDPDGDGDIDLHGQTLLRNTTYHGLSAGIMTQYGRATSTTGGPLPMLGATGPFRLGQTAQLRLTGAGGALALLGISSASAELTDTPFPGLTSWIDPAALHATLNVALGPIGASEQGHARVSIPVGVGLVGLTCYLQALLQEPGAGWSATNGLRLTFGS